MLYPEGCEDQISLAGRLVKTILVAYFIYIIGVHFLYTLINSDNLTFLIMSHKIIFKFLSASFSVFVHSEYQVKKMPHGVRCAKVNSCPEKHSPDSACSMEYSSSRLSSPEHLGEGISKTQIEDLHNHFSNCNGSLMR